MGLKGGWLQAEGRAGRWSRREARRRQWEGIEANWLLFLSMIGVMTVAGLAFGLYYGGWWGGFVAGVLISVGIGTPICVLLMITGSAPRSMGAFAEEQVSEAIQRGLTARARSFDRLAFKNWDVDHLVIAPSKVLAIETKWSADGWDVGDTSDDRLRSAVRQVTGSVRSLRLFLASTQIGLPLDVERLVVVCGPRGRDGVGVGSVDGCPVVRARVLQTWIESWCRDQGDAGLDEGTLAAGCGNIASFLEARDAYDATRSPEHFFVLHGAFAPMQSAFDAVMAFFAATLLSLGAFALGRSSVWLGLALMGLLLVGGATGLWRAGRRASFLGWMVAAAVLVTVLAISVVRSL